MCSGGTVEAAAPVEDDADLCRALVVPEEDVDALSTPTVAPPLLFGALAPPGDLLPWAWAQQRRAAAGNYWILPGGPPTPPQQEGWEPIVTAVPSIVYVYHELLHKTEIVAKAAVRQSDSRQRRRPHGARVL